MTARFAFVLVFALAPTAYADDLSGWWSIRGFDRPAEQAREWASPNNTAVGADGRFYIPADRLYSEYVIERAPEPGLPRTDSCSLDGQLMLREITGKPTECAMTLSHRCSARPGSRLTVVQACSVERKGDTVTIRGGAAAIAEAVPPHIWPTTYSPDTFTLAVSPDGKSMKGVGTRKSAAVVSITRIADLVE